MLRKKQQQGKKSDRIAQRVRELQAEEEEAQRIFQKSKTDDVGHKKDDDTYSCDDTSSYASSYSTRNNKCRRRKPRKWCEDVCLPSCLPSVGCGLPVFNYSNYGLYSGWGCGGFGWNLPPTFVSVPVIPPPLPLPPVCGPYMYGGPYIL